LLKNAAISIVKIFNDVNISILTNLKIVG
jgi:hypothetical protein